MLGIWFLLQQVFVSVRQRKQNQDVTGDPWDGRTLEWAISSPAPFYNFAHVPQVNELDQFWEDKQSGKAYKRPAKYEDIHMPKNTAAGVFIGAFGLVMCFALIWHIWWLSIVGFVGMIGSFIVRAYDRDVDYWVPAAEVERIENAHFDKMQKGLSHDPSCCHSPTRVTTITRTMTMVQDRIRFLGLSRRRPAHLLGAVRHLRRAGQRHGGRPTGKELFDLKFVLVETLLLLFSSFTFGMANLNVHASNKSRAMGWLMVTFLFGAGFIAMESMRIPSPDHQARRAAARTCRRSSR